jgi:hypothetical protein
MRSPTYAKESTNETLAAVAQKVDSIEQQRTAAPPGVAAERQWRQAGTIGSPKWMDYEGPQTAPRSKGGVASETWARPSNPADALSAAVALTATPRLLVAAVMAFLLSAWWGTELWQGMGDPRAAATAAWEDLQHCTHTPHPSAPLACWGALRRLFGAALAVITSSPAVAAGLEAFQRLPPLATLLLWDLLALLAALMLLQARPQLARRQVCVCMPALACAVWGALPPFQSMRA